jgi:hypothetical protein
MHLKEQFLESLAVSFVKHPLYSLVQDSDFWGGLFQHFPIFHFIFVQQLSAQISSLVKQNTF